MCISCYKTSKYRLLLWWPTTIRVTVSYNHSEEQQKLTNIYILFIIYAHYSKDFMYVKSFSWNNSRFLSSGLTVIMCARRTDLKNGHIHGASVLGWFRNLSILGGYNCPSYQDSRTGSHSLLGFSPTFIKKISLYVFFLIMCPMHS